MQPVISVPPPVLPTWEEFMVPVLDVLKDGKERSNRDVKSSTAQHAGLTQEQMQDLLPSGGPRALNRIGWALSFLTRAGALTRPRRGRYVITDSGMSLLQENPLGITEKHLQQIPAYNAYTPKSPPPPFSHTGEATASMSSDPGVAALDPTEQVESAIERLNADVTAQLLDQLRAKHPDFLEEAVLRVLVAMGYGGTEGRAQRLGGTGDGGVDGVIDQDPLGMTQVYVQAKRYAAQNTVGREAIQAFVGALHGNQASGGIFITTSHFTPKAIEYAHSVPLRVVLIDGLRLAGLMMKYQIGTQVVQTYHVLEVDEDFFE